jgi:hypothetical protein
VTALVLLAGHAWEWRAASPAVDRRPIHLAACPCWRNGGTLPAERRRAIRRPPASLWARLFGSDA